MQKASDIVHQQWLLRNSSWAPENQMQPFARLSPDEAQKDVDMVALGFSDYAKAQEKFLADVIKRKNAEIGKLYGKSPYGPEEVKLRNEVSALVDKLNLVKTQNRILQIKPAAAPAAVPAPTASNR